MADTLRLNGLKAGLAIKLGVGKTVQGYPPIVDIDPQSDDMKLVDIAASEAAKKGTETKRQRYNGRVSKVEMLTARLEKLIEAAERAPAPAPAPAPAQPSNGVEHQPELLPPQTAPRVSLINPERAQMFVGALIYKAGVTSLQSGDRLDGFAEIDSLQGDYLIGRQIGSPQRSFKIRVDVFLRRGYAYKVLRMPGATVCQWPGSRPCDLLAT